MTRSISVRLPNVMGARLLDGVRRAEALALVLVGLILTFHLGPLGLAIAAFLLASAVLLMPRERVASLSREEVRQVFLNTLHLEASQLRAEYISIRSRPLSESRAQDLWDIRRRIIVWLDSSRSRMKAYPEFNSIFATRLTEGGILHELDCSLECLSELKRLSTLSEKLRLPI